MPRPKRDLSGDLTVDGECFVWRLHREPQWCTADGWQGMMLAVRHADGQREAMLQFPMPARRTNGSPQLQRPKITLALVTSGIAAALAQGWEPTSRGKPIVVELEAEGR